MPSRSSFPVWLAPAAVGAVLSVAGLLIVHELGEPPPSAPQSAKDAPVSPTPTPAQSQTVLSLPSTPSAEPSPEAAKTPVIGEETPTPQPGAEGTKTPNAIQASPEPRPTADAAAPAIASERTPQSAAPAAPTLQPAQVAHEDAKPADLPKQPPQPAAPAHTDVGRAAVESDGAAGRRKPAPAAVSRASLAQRTPHESCPPVDNRRLIPWPQPASRRAARYSARWR